MSNQRREEGFELLRVAGFRCIHQPLIACFQHHEYAFQRIDIGKVGGLYSRKPAGKAGGGKPDHCGLAQIFRVAQGFGQHRTNRPFSQRFQKQCGQRLRSRCRIAQEFRMLAQQAPMDHRESCFMDQRVFKSVAPHRSLQEIIHVAAETARTFRTRAKIEGKAAHLRRAMMFGR